jgi:DNA replication protein DnaC
MDVVDYAIPQEPVVCYFYDPFDECIMTEVLRNIRTVYLSSKKSIIIVYYIARFSHLFDAEPWLERIHHIGAVMIWSSKSYSPAAAKTAPPTPGAA